MVRLLNKHKSQKHLLGYLVFYTSGIVNVRHSYTGTEKKILSAFVKPRVGLQVNLLNAVRTNSPGVLGLNRQPLAKTISNQIKERMILGGKMV